MVLWLTVAEPDAETQAMVRFCHERLALEQLLNRIHPAKKKIFALFIICTPRYKNPSIMTGINEFLHCVQLTLGTFISLYSLRYFAMTSRPLRRTFSTERKIKRPPSFRSRKTIS